MTYFLKPAPNIPGGQKMSSKGDQTGTADRPLSFGRNEIESSIPERFERVANRFPNRLAVKTANTALTYDELDRESNRIAQAILTRCGMGAEPVVFLLEDGAESIVAILGVLKAGKFYVALDPSLPQNRLSDVLKDTATGLIVTDGKYFSLAAELAGNRVRLINMDEPDSHPSCEKIVAPISSDSLAAIFYTSGSTGQPKGVMNNHRNILHFAWRKTNDYRICIEDHQSLLSSCSFIASVPDIFQTLLNGASLYPYNVRDAGPDGLIKWLVSEEITLFRPPVELFRQLFSSLTEEKKFKKVRLVVLSGQPITREDVENFRRYFPKDCVLWHTLGSTEAGVLAHICIDGKTEINDNIVPVGYADSDKEIFLLDENGEKVGPDRVGEIAVKSRYLSPGYWRKPELTRQKFQPDPDGGDKRIFVTGDLGLMWPDGRLELQGRKGFQVKIRGYRVDLTEIEAVLSSNNRIKESVVVARDNENGEKYLAAYLVPSASCAPNVSEFRRFLLETMPDYMIPLDFVILREFPLTPTGKVDRKALPEPDRTRPDLDADLVSPRDALELRLTRVWERLLDIRPIGVRDNFFELGGHSILAMRMFSRIERITGKTLPVTVLFQAPTIEELAKILVKEGWSPSRISLVPVQPSGSKPPLFYVPPAAMTILGAADLSKYLGPDQPFYGLQPRGISGKDIPPHTSVEEMAACYVEEIRQIQPEGAYFLAGRCFGGVVVYEMAQQLLEQGQEVALLVVLDTILPPGFLHKLEQRKNRQAGIRSPGRHGARRLRRYIGRLIYYLSERPRQLPRVLRRKAKAVKRRLFRRTRTKIKRIGNVIKRACKKNYRAVIRISINPQKRRVHRVEDAHYYAKRAYVPRVYPGKITCFWPAESNEKEAEHRLGWKKMSTDKLETHVVPGDHYSMTGEPHVRVLAQQLKVCLEKAQADINKKSTE